MIEAHLKPGEMAKLFLYFMIKDPKLQEVYRELEEMYSDKGQGLPNRTEILEYAFQSPFGNTPEEITKNAKSHFSSCLYCLQEYNSKVRSEALISAFMYECLCGKVGIGVVGGFKERFNFYVKELDCLGLLSQ